MPTVSVRHFDFVIPEHPWGQESSMGESPFEGEEHCFTLHMAFFFRDHS